MRSRNLLRNLAASIVLAFVLSTLFWLIWDVFVLSGFLVFSILCGGAGALLAAQLHRGLPTALVLTAVIRIVVFVALAGIWF